eukprot:3232857-Amphidinium_carterae.1
MCHVTREDPDRSEMWLKTMLEHGVKAMLMSRLQWNDGVSYCTVIDAAARAGDLVRAEAWLCHMEDVSTLQGIAQNCLSRARNGLTFVKILVSLATGQ